MIKVYGKEDCSKCLELKNILESNNKDFEYLEDLQALRIAASKARIMMAPVVEYQEKFYSMDQFLSEVGL